MFCSKCGKKIPDDSNLCPYCGDKIEDEIYGEDIKENSNQEESKQEKLYGVSSKSRTTAMFLCALGLIGFAGLHRMYVGKWWSGILYAGTFGLLGFGTLYDFYMIYMDKFHDCDEYPIYSDASMKSNYRKRDPKKKDVKLEIILAVIVLAMINTSLNPLFMDSQHNKTEKQQMKQAQLEKEQQQKEEKKRQDEEIKQKKEEENKILSAKRTKFNEIMKKSPIYVNDGLAGYELQIIVSERWSNLKHEDKQKFILDSLNALNACELVGKVQSVSFRYKLDGKKLATFDPSEGTRIYH